MSEDRSGRAPGDPVAASFPREPLPGAFVARTMARVRAERSAGLARPPRPLRGFGLDALVALAGAVVTVAMLWAATAGAAPAALAPAGGQPGALAAWATAALLAGVGAGGMALAAWLATPSGAAR